MCNVCPGRTRRRFTRAPRRTLGAVLLGGLVAACAGDIDDEIHDRVVLDGRLVDPASETDDVRNLGIQDGRIAAVTDEPIQGTDTIHAHGLVVAPGFIDMHAHGQDEENERLKARDGRTTLLELEVGTAEVEAWYRDRAEEARLNHGVSVGHIPIRIELFDDPASFLPSGPAADRTADENELALIREGIEQGLAEGALGVGFGLQYTPAASRGEVLEAFRAGADHPEAPAFVHLRHMGDQEPESSLAALKEVVAAAAMTGRPLHIHHIHSMGISATADLLEALELARDQGMDITAEVYPYTAAMTSLESAIFDEGWDEIMGIGPEDLEWAATGERLTWESFEAYREQGGSVIMHFIPDEALDAALSSPFAVIASDGRLTDGEGHPRTAGTAARVLGRYVREEGRLDLMEAIDRLSYLPARRLEGRVPAMERKGRLEPGADADLVLFDPDRVTDRATFEEPNLPSEGIEHVLVHGVSVVHEGELVEDARPGRAVRAPLAP